MNRTLLVVACTLLALGVGMRTVQAQGTSGASLVVTVRAAESNEPLGNVHVTLRQAAREMLTDERGRAVFIGLQAGTDTIDVRQLGYAPQAAQIVLTAGATRSVLFGIAQRAHALPTVTVRAKRKNAVPNAGFADRQKRGFGAFITRKDIEQQQPSRSSDLLRHVAGIQLRPTGAGYEIAMARMPVRCKVRVFLDGVPLPTEESEFGPASARGSLVSSKDQSGRQEQERIPANPNVEVPGFVIDQLQPEQIEAIEVYRGPAEVPAEFNISGADCGVVVIWMRNYREQQPRAEKPAPEKRASGTHADAKPRIEDRA